MLFALCALAVLTLGAVALVRSVDTGILVLGNLGFKKDAVYVASQATETAITWLQNNTANGGLDADVPLKGYYATAPDNIDPTGGGLATSTGTVTLVNWGTTGCTAPGTSGRTVVCLTPVDQTISNDTTVSYVITRLCLSAGPNDSKNSCVVPVTSQATASSQRGALQPGGRFITYSNGTAYRILTRTVGTRGTVAYTETLVHF